MNQNAEFDLFLEQSGVTTGTLAAAEKDSLDRDGYVVLPAVIDARELDLRRNAFESAIKLQHKSTDGENSGTRHISDLVNTDSTFDIAFTHPKILAAVHHVLKRPFKLTQFGGRDPLPGYGQQGLHTDGMHRSPGDPYRVVTAIWMLDDFTANNGATRVVPRTHLQIKPIPKSLTAPTNRHPEQLIVTAKAGSVLVFNGHLWHSGMRNDSKSVRRTLQCSFYSREMMMSGGRVECDRPGRLSPTARYILGVSSFINA